jgi:hypothetical protein
MLSWGLAGPGQVQADHPGCGPAAKAVVGLEHYLLGVGDLESCPHWGPGRSHGEMVLHGPAACVRDREAQERPSA